MVDAMLLNPNLVFQNNDLLGQYVHIDDFV